jgi:NADH-quinone oxidoreductase subunit L
MHGDERFHRFFTNLNLFAASMLTLVLAGNYAMLFLGWELVGLCSFLLIGFWYTRPSASAAAKKAFVVNRIGDFGFMVGLMLVFATFGTLSFSGIFERAGEELTGGLATAIGLLFLVGAAGKSAQIPLYVWLPDAMEGPTPVSALIHAATMVTAGVYVIARSAPIYEFTPFASTSGRLLPSGRLRSPSRSVTSRGCWPTRPSPSWGSCSSPRAPRPMWPRSSIS